MGAGFGGLGMAIRLKQQGTDDFVLIERGADVGGTWWANSYPGCQCDIPSNLYSFSFARNPNWDRAYPMRDQILEYLRDCAERFGILPHTRLGCELLGATWVAAEQRWELETTTGPLAARVLVAAPGLLSEPWSPSLPGLDGFRGNVFHTAAWDHSDDLAGKRVALVGSGATAVQVVPEIQPRLAKLHLFQRTPPWVVPHTRPPGPPSAARAVPPRAPAPAGLARRDLRAARDLRARHHARQALASRPGAARAAPPPPPGARSGAAAAPDAGLRDLLQAHHPVERVVSGDPGAERRHRQLRHPGAARGLRRRRRRASSARSTRSSSPPASSPPSCRSPSASAAATAAHSRRSGAAARRPTSARPSPASRICSSSTGRT